MTIMERWFDEVWNKGREEAIDEMAAFKSFHKTFRSAFSDIHVKVEETITEGDRTVARCHVTGTHTGDSLGRPSTGKPVTFHGMTMVRVKDGKIVESWNNFDFMTMYKQLE